MNPSEECVLRSYSVTDVDGGYDDGTVDGLNLRIRQIQLIYENTPAALLINFASAVVASFILYLPVPRHISISWIGGILCLLICRGLLWYRFTRQSFIPDKNYVLWERCMLLAVTVNGFWWGFFGVLTFVYSGPVEIGYSGFVLGGIAAGGVATLGPLLFAYICFTLPIVTCMLVVLFWLGNDSAYTMVGLTMAFLVSLTVTVWRVNRFITSNFTLTLKNENLVKSLILSNSRLSATNANLEFEIEERVRAEKQIEFMATHDALTGLANRRLQEDRFKSAAARALRNGHRLAILFIDLDFFKDVNDSLGHPVGDKVLQIVAGRLIECLRSGESVCRHGGDEFLLLAEIDETSEVEVIAGRIIDSVSQPIVVDSREIHIGASLGISLYPDDGKDFNQLVIVADEALYAAKRGGKGQFRFYEEALYGSVG